MKKQNTFKAAFFLILSTIAVTFFLYLYFSGNITGQVTFSQPVYLPTYGQIYCSQLPVQINQDFSMNSREQTFHCGTGTQIGDVNAYVPYSCNYFAKQAISYRICKEGEDCSLGFWGSFLTADSSRTFNVKQGEKISFYVGLIGSPSSKNFNVQAQPYGLRQGEYGKVLFTNNCDIRSLSLDYLPGSIDRSNLEGGYILQPTTHISNYIVGSIPITDSQNIINKNGQNIYIFAPGWYYPIKTSEDGKLYADTNSPTKDNTIVCMPSTPYCKSDGTAIVGSPDGKSCSELSGNIEGYLQINSDTVCKYQCINNVLSKTNDCKKIINCDSSQPFFNPNTGKCEAGGLPNAEKDACTYKATQNPLFGYKWVQSDTKPSVFTKIITFGQAKDNNSGGYCQASYLLYFIYLFLILILILLIFLILKYNVKKKQSRKKS